MGITDIAATGSKGTNVPPPDRTPGINQDLALYDRDLFPTLLDQDPLAVAARFAKRFAKAQSLDDLFNVLTGQTSKNLVGRKFEIRGVAWAPYESDDGIIPLAVVDAVDLDSGEITEFATTSMMVTLFIRQAELVNLLPFKCRITSKKTRSGRDALNLEPV